MEDVEIDDARRPNGCRIESGYRSREAAGAGSVGQPNSTGRATAAQAATSGADLRTRQLRSCRHVRQAFNRTVSRHSGRRVRGCRLRSQPYVICTVMVTGRGDIMKATQELRDLGQSLWLDNINRAMLKGGMLERYINEYSVTGLTSNPTIFDQSDRRR